ncbi:MAG: aminotransferase [Desulfovibrio sp. MES5]|nr:MAG: aminotransferase [Desulfovibrio sp. MES5]
MLWEGCTPVFADIDQDTLCLSPKSILETLQRHPDAAGIMPVHVYGNACDIEEIERICSDHSLVCIYDAAHAFGARYKGRSLLDYGDYAVCSFHATKLFHTVEGGCIVSHSEEQEHAIELLHAFGHIGDQHYSLGINGKLSELHAAMGLAVLPYIGEIMQSRSEVFGYYEEFLPKEGVARPTLQDGLQYNYAYFPVLFSSEAELLLIKSALEEANIFPRRYFYPSLTTLPYLPEISKKCLCPIADSIAPRVLSLPLYPGLQKGDVQRIAEILARNIR